MLWSSFTQLCEDVVLESKHSEFSAVPCAFSDECVSFCFDLLVTLMTVFFLCSLDKFRASVADQDEICVQGYLSLDMIFIVFHLLLGCDYILKDGVLGCKHMLLMGWKSSRV